MLDSPGRKAGAVPFLRLWTTAVSSGWLHKVNYSNPARERVIVYIDGFNLYHGLKDSSLRSSRWLDIVGLCEAILLPHQDLHLVRYFTAIVKRDAQASGRQTTYLDALVATGGIEIHKGFYQVSNAKMKCHQCGDEQARCPSCKARYQRFEEKQSDVNMALHLLADAEDDCYDTAMLITGDSDLVPAIALVKQRFPAKNVVAAFPPKRSGKHIAAVADAALKIEPKHCRQNRLPPIVMTSSGVELHAPEGWLPAVQP